MNTYASEWAQIRIDKLLDAAARSNLEFRAGEGLGLWDRDRRVVRELARRGHPQGLAVRVVLRLIAARRGGAS